MFNEELYIQLRTREGRIYSDSTLAKLPYVDSSDKNASEWRIRAASFDKLKNYLMLKNKPLNMLDLGCGNGWMTSRLSAINNSTVTGLDMNRAELKQASRVFESNQQIKFIYGDVFGDIVEPKSFDTIIMAASVQYFGDLKLLINRLLSLLKAGGEIHILDSNFYGESKKSAAQKRTLDYYKQIGFEQFAGNYHHHTLNELQLFNYKILNRSLKDLWILKVLRDNSLMFPWIVISH